MFLIGNHIYGNILQLKEEETKKMKAKIQEGGSSDGSPPVSGIKQGCVTPSYTPYNLPWQFLDATQSGRGEEKNVLLVILKQVTSDTPGAIFCTSLGPHELSFPFSLNRTKEHIYTPKASE